MSIRAITWAFDIESISPATKIVLLALADNADEDTGAAFPSQATLARKTNQSVDSVQRKIKELVAEGLIYVTKNKSRAATNRSEDDVVINNLYIVLFSSGAKSHAVSLGWLPPARSEERTGENDPAKHAANCGSLPAKHAAGETQACRTGNVSEPQLCGTEPSGNCQGTSPPTPKASEPDRVLEGGASLDMEKRAETALAAWERFRRAWIFDPTESVEAARREFFRLSGEDRDKALARAGDYLGECRRRIRKVKHARTWLADKGWQAFEVGIGPSIVAKATGSVRRGDGIWTIFEGGPQAAAWREYLAANGLPALKFIPRNGGPGFCSRPSEWPPPAARQEAG